MSADASPTTYADDAELEHGWASTTALTDTIHRRSVLALAESTARPSEAMGARSVRAHGLVATSLGRPAGYWNAAVVTRPLDQSGWDRALGAVEDLEATATAGPGAVDLWSPFPTPDLHDRGWLLAGHPVAMWRPAGGSPGAPDAPPPATALEVERVATADGVAEWARTAVEGYPLDADPTAVASAELLDADDVHLHVGRSDGKAVAVSATVVACGTNAVAFVATRPEARGRGYGRAMTWAATTVRPDIPAALLASDEGRPLYEDMGYLAHSRWTMWVRPHR